MTTLLASPSCCPSSYAQDSASGQCSALIAPSGVFPFPLLGVHGELGPLIGFQSEKLMETVEVESARLNNQLRRVGFRFHK